MKVQLRKAISRLGQAGAIVEVKDAYARNYLIPKGLAQPATPQVVQSTARQQARDEGVRRAAARSAAQAREALRAVKLICRAEASPQGRLFAALRVSQLRAQIESEFRIQLDGVRIEPDHWKTLGENRAQLHWPDGQVLEFTFIIEHA